MVRIWTPSPVHFVSRVACKGHAQNRCRISVLCTLHILLVHDQVEVVDVGLIVSVVSSPRFQVQASHGAASSFDPSMSI